jgi:hypothetical protein
MKSGNHAGILPRFVSGQSGEVPARLFLLSFCPFRARIPMSRVKERAAGEFGCPPSLVRLDYTASSMRCHSSFHTAGKDLNMALAQWFRRGKENRNASAASRRLGRQLLRLEVLEDRTLLSGGPEPTALPSGSGSSSGGPSPSPAILSTGGPGSGQVVVVNPTGGGGPGGGPGYPLPPVTGPGLSGSFGGTSGSTASLPVSLQGSTVAIVPVVMATSNSGPQPGTSGPSPSNTQTTSGGPSVAPPTPPPPPTTPTA